MISFIKVWENENFEDYQEEGLMNIGIDARLLSGRITGIGRYLLNILKYLPEMDSKTNYHLFAYEDINFRSSFYKYHFIKRSNLPRQLYEHYWLNFLLPDLLEENKMNVFFTPYILVPIRKRNYRNVVAIHDAIPQACKSAYSSSYRKYMNIFVPISIKRSDAITTVSESSKKEIVKYYNADPEKIYVMHLWTDDEYKIRSLSLEERERLKSKYLLPDKFILYVGAIEERKNIKGIVSISDIMLSRGYKVNIVLVGKKGFGYHEINLELEKRKERFVHLELVDEKDLPLLYNMASIFIFPTTYEGFGLPPLEAMKSGIPVITSNNTSLPEVVGSAGIMLNYTDYSGFADSIIKVLEDQCLYTEIVNKAVKHAEKFNPENQLPKLLSLFHT